MGSLQNELELTDDKLLDCKGKEGYLFLLGLNISYNN